MLKIITNGILAISLLIAPQLHAASDLSSLSDEAQNAISRLCSPVQYREGAAAYRRCVQSELESLQQGGSNGLATLSFDDKYAVQQFCANAGDTHQSCVSKQVASVRDIPAPSMENIADDEQYAIQQSCFLAQSTQGLLAYRQCVGNEVASLQQLPRIELTGMPVLERNALQLRCSANSKTASAYRQCLAVEFASFSNVAPTYQTTPAAQTVPIAPVEQATVQAVTTEAPTQVAEVTKPEPESQSDSQAVTTIAAALPVSNTLPRNIDPQRATDTQSASIELETIPTPETTSAESSTTSLGAAGVSAAGVSATGVSATGSSAADNSAADVREISNTIAAATATTVDTPKPISEPRVITKPKLVEQVAQIEAEANNNVTPEAAPGAGLVKFFNSASDSIKDKFDSLTTLGKAVAAAVLAIPFLIFALRKLLQRNREPQIEQWEDDYQAGVIPNTIRTNSSTEAIKARWDDDFLNDETRRTQPYVAEPAVKPAEDTDTAATRLVQRPRQHTAPMQIETRWQSGFGKWLDTEATAERQQHCTEFLIYWMAYGDERYQTGLKERIFSEQNPNQHDLIKRWVLKQDVFAFADAINWLKRNTSKAQQEQILDLLMALLIAENTITPNQNIILRMLADAWGIGSAALQERFKHTFAQDLPPFPRADKQSWWTEQSVETIIRWDARHVAKLPEFEQMLFRLGLREEYTESDVVKSFRRAAQRCHPDRFSQLGKWEQSLAERQFEKFEEARDKLLGVSV